MEIGDIYIYIYIYIYIRATHFSSTGPVVRNVGGVISKARSLLVTNTKKCFKMEACALVTV